VGAAEHNERIECIAILHMVQKLPREAPPRLDQQIEGVLLLGFPQMTVNEWVWRKDQKLTEGIHRFMYWPACIIRGLERRSCILTAPLSCMIVARGRWWRKTPFLTITAPLYRRNMDADIAKEM
jgi:hypothetical protein